MESPPGGWTTLARLALFLSLLVICWGLSACSDSSAPEGSNFSITVTVTTAGGDPVVGLRAALSPDLDDRYITWPYAEPFSLPGAEELTIRIYDLEDRLVRRIVRESPGHFVYWTGLDDAGQPVPDGVYRHVYDMPTDDGLEMVVTLVLFVAGDPTRRADGLTDEAGGFTVTDRTHVPAFYDLDPIEVLVPGEFEPEYILLEPRVRMTLLDDQGRHQVVVFDAVDGPQTVEVTWDPASR